jgi:hypothetical protein
VPTKRCEQKGKILAKTYEKVSLLPKNRDEHISTYFSIHLMFY